MDAHAFSGKWGALFFLSIIYLSTPCKESLAFFLCPHVALKTIGYIDFPSPTFDNEGPSCPQADTIFLIIRFFFSSGVRQFFSPLLAGLRSKTRWGSPCYKLSFFSFGEEKTPPSCVYPPPGPPCRKLRLPYLPAKLPLSLVGWVRNPRILSPADFSVICSPLRVQLAPKAAPTFHKRFFFTETSSRFPFSGAWSIQPALMG